MVSRGIYQNIASRHSDAEQQALLRLIDREASSAFTASHRIKEAPKSATLTHLDEWLSGLTWLQSLGNDRRLQLSVIRKTVNPRIMSGRSCLSLWITPEKPSSSSRLPTKSVWSFRPHFLAVYLSSLA